MPDVEHYISLFHKQFIKKLWRGKLVNSSERKSSARTSYALVCRKPKLAFFWDQNNNKKYKKYKKKPKKQNTDVIWYNHFLHQLMSQGNETRCSPLNGSEFMRDVRVAVRISTSGNNNKNWQLKKTYCWWSLRKWINFW